MNAVESNSAPEGYEKLVEVLNQAVEQAAYGKGKERHATGEPFHEQPICSITRRLGLGYPLGQAEKKIEESTRLETESAIFELLGSINYMAAAIIVMSEEEQERTGGQPLNETQEPTHLHYYDNERVTVAIDDLVEELQRAEIKHPVWPTNQLRQTAIVSGEAGEAMQASLHVAEGRGEMSALRTEIIQTGAMCLRWLINEDK